VPYTDPTCINIMCSYIRKHGRKKETTQLPHGFFLTKENVFVVIKNP
jgi:hypothetical protein